MRKDQYVSIPYASLKMGQQLGRGVFGKVFKGQYQFADVAIKELILEKLSTDSLEELQEASIMSKLLHPNVVQFYGACMERGHYAIVMEYVGKGSLYNILHSDTEIPWAMQVCLSIDMGAGLVYLHNNNILHRDLKSLNVLVTDNNRAKLTDFGLSKIKHETNSTTKQSTSFVGSILWMAPELFEPEVKYEKSADVYSYGMTMYELATRKLPFANASSTAVVPTWIAKGYRDKISAETPQPFSALIAKCWAQRAEDRPTAVHAVEELQRMSSNELASTQQFSDKVTSTSETSTTTSDYFDNLASFSITPPKTQQPAIQKPTIPANSPVAFMPPPKPQPIAAIAEPQTAHEQITKQANVIANQVNTQDVVALLKWVAEGHLEETEKLLKKNPELTLAQGDIKDLSDRVFANITAFQLAVWYLDSEMWELILKYLDKNQAALQLFALENNRKDISNKHGTHFNFDSLLKAYQIYIKDYQKWDDKEREEHWWCKKIGGEQCVAPAWYIYAFCEEGQDKAWPTTDVTKAVVRDYAKAFVLKWRTKIYDKGVAGDTFAWCRGSMAQAGSDELLWWIGQLGFGSSSVRGVHDFGFTKLLKSKHQEQLNKLKASLHGIPANSSVVFIPPPKSQPAAAIAEPQTAHEQITKQAKALANQLNEDVAALLKWVVKGHLVEAEKLLQKNPKLALAQGDVKDPADRVFTNITAFQYAVWALDGEMWHVILKYIDETQASLQLFALENNRKDISDKHGTHFNFDPLLKEYQTYLDNHRKWDDKQCEEHWCKKVGGEQCKVPAWYIYAFCEEGKDKAWPTQDVTKTVVRDYAKAFVPKWCTKIYNSGVTGEKFAWSRGTYDDVTFSEGHWMLDWRLDPRHDRECTQLLKSKQQEQLSKLKASLHGLLNIEKLVNARELKH